MPLTDAKCTNCGAPLKVDSSKDAAICRYCGSAFIVEKAIQNYYFSGNITNNINADVVNVMGQSEFVIRAGELEEYHGESMDVVVPANVKSIKGGYTGGPFHNCRNLNSIQLPEGLREIDALAFSGCTHLKSINIPSTVVSIGDNAFSYCESLKSITLPNGLREINRYTFSNCTSLTSVTIPDSVTIIGQNAFDGCTSLKTLNIPDSVTNVEPLGYCINLTSINIPDNTLDIGLTCCPNLTDVKVNILPNRVIAPYRFKDTPFYPKYQQMLKDHGYCPICGTKLTGLLFKSCPRKCKF